MGGAHKRVHYRSVDAATKDTIKKLPLLTVKAGPRDGDDWIKRMKEEYMSLIAVRRPRPKFQLNELGIDVCIYRNDNTTVASTNRRVCQ